MRIFFHRRLILLILILVSGCAHGSGTGVVQKETSSVYIRPSLFDISPGDSENAVPADENGGTVKNDPVPVADPGNTSGGEHHNEENSQGLLDTALELAQQSQDFWSNGELDKAIETLDQSYATVLKVDTNRYPELFQQKEDMRFTISKRILEIYASRFTAVDGNHNAIPLIMNRHIEDEIRHFQTDEREFFVESYKRSGLYRDNIVQALKSAGLPVELSWLPLIESGFKVNALSPARALGLWQFIPSTGYKYGLKRDTWIDERLDPEKATSAAIDYLTELHDIFGDWTTVLAGYNCGEARVLRLIRDQKINYLDHFWDLYELLPRETARYVPRFLATLHIINFPEKYGFSFEELYPQMSYDIVTTEKQIELKALADALGLPVQDLHSLNPELRREVTPPSPYDLKIPPGESDRLIAKLDQIPVWSPSVSSLSAGISGYVYHRVKSGETLSHISRKYHARLEDILRVNHLRKNSIIRTGRKLRIPLRGKAGESVAQASHPGGKYRIQRGDSLWLVAKKFDTDTKTLMRINNLRSTRLSVGQVLRVTN